MPEGALSSETSQAEAPDDTLRYRALTGGGDDSPAFNQFAFGRRIDHVAFTERLPIQPVGFIEQDFVEFRSAGGPLGRAKDDANPRFKPHPLFGAQDDGGVLTRAGEF